MSLETQEEWSELSQPEMPTRTLENDPTDPTIIQDDDTSCAQLDTDVGNLHRQTLGHRDDRGLICHTVTNFSPLLFQGAS
jgi:hypothetical protein